VEDEEIVVEQIPLPTNNRNDTSEEEDENVPPEADNVLPSSSFCAGVILCFAKAQNLS
jgi:hypothetical protein